MWEDLVAELRDRGLAFAAGLTESEVASAESRYGFRFPPDLRAFLQTALPQGQKFPDWRSGDEAVLRDWFDFPRQGILHDIEHNQFWLEEWGPRPTTLEEAQDVATRLIAAAPKLIPIYSHRMMPGEPHLPGNPVFSVHQTDIIYYGAHLRDYLATDFLGVEHSSDSVAWNNIRKIPFWDIDRFQGVRWAHGPFVFDNRRDVLP